METLSPFALISSPFVSIYSRLGSLDSINFETEGHLCFFCSLLSLLVVPLTLAIVTSLCRPFCVSLSGHLTVKIMSLIFVFTSVFLKS